MRVAVAGCIIMCDGVSVIRPMFTNSLLVISDVYVLAAFVRKHLPPGLNDAQGTVYCNFCFQNKWSLV